MKARHSRPFLQPFLALLTAFCILSAAAPFVTAADAAAGTPATATSPLGYTFAGINVQMKPGQSGTTQTNTGELLSRWCMDSLGYFTISLERYGSYGFSFTNLRSGNEKATFGVTLVGAGGGGGGAEVHDESTGQGGCGGDVVKCDWSPNISGLKISGYLGSTHVEIGAGGSGGRPFTICRCGGSACPIGLETDSPWADGQNSGFSGGATVFGSLSAAGGAGGRGGAGSGGRYSGKKGPSGSNGKGAGLYTFWGVTYYCGFGGNGGEFGGNNGSAGDPTYFHDGYNSFGRTGSAYGGKGNGGGGGGFSYSYGHPQYTGTGTGTGMGSYSSTFIGTRPTGNSDTNHGYIYIEGKVNIGEETKEDGTPAYQRFRLEATVYPTSICPAPTISWTTSNADVAEINPTGVVILKKQGKAIITATASNGVQGYYPIDNTDSEKIVNIAPSSPVSQVGDTAKMLITIIPNEKDFYVSWISTNDSVIDIDPYSGSLTATGEGTAAVTATLIDGTQASYIFTIGSPTTVSGSNITSINVFASSTAVNVGDTVQMQYSTYPKLQCQPNWTVSDTAVATVSKTGEVSFIAEGQVTVTASVSGVSSKWTFLVGDDALKDGGFDSREEASGEKAGSEGGNRGEMYTVKEGDNILAIAGLRYGNPLYYKLIVAINNDRLDAGETMLKRLDIKDSPIFSPGDIIYIPTLEEVEAYEGK